MKCGFNGEEADDGVTMGGLAILGADKLRYLGSIIQGKGDIDSIERNIRVGRQKWSAFGVVCDKKIHVGLKGMVYHMVVRPALLYGSEYWLINKSQVARLRVGEMRMIR